VTARRPSRRRWRPGPFRAVGSARPSNSAVVRHPQGEASAGTAARRDLRARARAPHPRAAGQGPGGGQRRPRVVSRPGPGPLLSTSRGRDRRCTSAWWSTRSRPPPPSPARSAPPRHLDTSPHVLIVLSLRSRALPHRRTTSPLLLFSPCSLDQVPRTARSADAVVQGRRRLPLRVVPAPPRRLLSDGHPSPACCTTPDAPTAQVPKWRAALARRAGQHARALTRRRRRSRRSARAQATGLLSGGAGGGLSIASLVSGGGSSAVTPSATMGGGVLKLRATAVRRE
jgi:hypothetical protein